MTRKKRRLYDDKFRASTVVMLEAAGYPHKKGALTTVSNNVGVPRRTISRWFRKENNPPPGEIVNIKKIEFIDALKAERQYALKQMGEVRDEATYKDLATVVAIFTDKEQLLLGNPTETNETRILIEYADTNTNAT